jgi:hypothetical protein
MLPHPVHHIPAEQEEPEEPISF